MAGDQGKKRIAHVVSHTHWDREWRYPIWETRFMLVDFMDELLEVLESGKYPAFLLDGQCSPIMDYLEVRPENGGRIMELIKADKLQIGPWYTLPDEYPVDGEALVRNLLWGRRISEGLGKVMNIGYTPFGWGQTAQLAQIYAGFGMDVAMIGKRVSKERAPQSEFVWRSPDGSELLASRFGVWGRQNFYFYFHLSALFGTEHTGLGWNYDWANAGVIFHRADDEQFEQDMHRVDPPAEWYPEWAKQEVLDKAWWTTDESVMPNDRLMMNGCDYAASQPMFPEMLAKINEMDTADDREWIHTSMPAFVDLMRKNIDRSKLEVVEGELRDGPAGHVTGNALTTRLALKRLNKKAQNLLIRFAEPFAVAGALHGIEYPTEFMRMAWDFMLQSHPHDSINGVTQDKTVEDNTYRINQVIDLSQSIGNRTMQQFVSKIDLSGFEDDDVLVVAFNPSPYPRREIAKAWLHMPCKPEGLPSWPGTYRNVVMCDADGNMLDTQNMGSERDIRAVAEIHTRARPFINDRYLVHFDTGEIPAGGYKVFKAAWYDEENHPPKWQGAGGNGALERTECLLTAPNAMENEHLRVSVEGDGTFTVVDKATGKTYAGLNYYEDRGEHGEYWINTRPMFDQVITSLGCPARTWSEQVGPLTASLVSEVTMQIPIKGDKPNQKRGVGTSELKLKATATLRAGSKQVDVEVEFENRQEDHYLRVMFPTGLSEATHADAGGHFTVDRRPIRPTGPQPSLVWPDMATLPHNMFVDVSDGANGIAFLNDSLMEYEVTDTPDRVVALSLLRSVPNWVCTEGRVGSGWPSQKGGQALGWHKVHYAIRPHEGTWEQANVANEAELFNVPLRLVQTRKSSGELPAKQASFYGIDNPLIRFAALKRAHDRASVVARVYNPTGQEQSGNLTLMANVGKAWLTDLNEERGEELTVSGGHSVKLSVPPQKIVTVEIEPA